MSTTTASPATTSNTPVGTGDIVGTQDDDLAMFDTDPGEFKAAPVNDGETIAQELDSINSEMELGTTAQSTKEATTTSSTDSDAQPDQLDTLRQQAQQFGYSAEDVQSLDADTIQRLVDTQRNLVLQAGAAAQAQQFQPNPWQAPQQQIPQGQYPQGQPQQGYGAQPQGQFQAP